MKKKILASATVCLALLLGSCSSTPDATPEDTTTAPVAESSAPTKIEQIRAFVPTTMAFGAPMSGFGLEGHLSDVTDKTEVSNWDGVEQLKAVLSQGETEVAATPSNVAANLYNKGVDVRLIASVVWGMLYVLGPADAPEGDWEALRDKKIAVMWPGHMPDLVFSYLLAQNNMTKDSDIIVVPAESGELALSKLLQGEVDFALLPEHAASIALMKAKENGKEIKRVLNLQEEWAEVTGKEPKFPMASLVMPGALVDEHPELPEAIRAEVSATVEKANGGDEETLQRIADKYQLPLPLVKQVIPRLQLNVVPATEARSEYEDFLTRIGEINPKIYGGKLPDDAFYAK